MLIPSLSSICLGFLLAGQSQGFYLPGVAPKDYEEGHLVPLYVNALDAEKSLIPYDYYHKEFHFCAPEKGPVAVRESLGSALFGDRIFTSPFQIKSLVNETCRTLCTATVPKADAEFIGQRIIDGYIFNWLIDGLPAARPYYDASTKEEFYSAGFELGEINTNSGKTEPALNNHYEILIHYHLKEGDTKRARVVGVIVQPYSISGKDQDNCNTSPNRTPQYIDTSKTSLDIKYTYSVRWIKDPVNWGTRWDHYLHIFEPQIHWFNIINAIVIVFILATMVSMILLRALNRDIARYNSLDDEEGAQEEFGWKLVHADVFRPPAHRMILSVFVGNGFQLLSMASVTLVFAVLGFLSPSSRGALATMVIVCYVLFSAVAGYVSAIMYKTLQGEHWKRNVVLTSMLVPGIFFSILLILNFILVGYGSSAAVPVGTLFALMAMWFLVSMPLCVAGAFVGYRHPGYENPCKTNQIPRQIPPQPFYLSKFVAPLIGGILPFGAVFIELYFIMSSIWAHRVYYMFGFLFIVFLILIVTCSLTSILMCYFQLCAEDYGWSWRSFMTSGASGLYVLLYSILYYTKQLHMDNAASGVIFFAWSLVISFAFSIFTGAIGYIASFIFVRTIYSAIKVD